MSNFAAGWILLKLVRRCCGVHVDGRSRGTPWLLRGVSLVLVIRLGRRHHRVFEGVLSVYDCFVQLCVEDNLPRLRRTKAHMLQGRPLFDG